MELSPFRFILAVFEVAAVVFAARWLLNANATQFPQTRGNTHIYGIKWQMRVIGCTGSLVFLVIIIAFRHDWVIGGGRWLVWIPISLIFLGVGIATGSVATDENGITKKTVGFSRSIRWGEITEIRFHPKQSHLEVFAGPRKLSIDLRFVAIQKLLDEIATRTNLQPKMM
jgi:hypothetical protein